METADSDLHPPQLGALWLGGQGGEGGCLTPHPLEMLESFHHSTSCTAELG